MCRKSGVLRIDVLDIVGGEVETLIFFEHLVFDVEYRDYAWVMRLTEYGDE